VDDIAHAKRLIAGFWRVSTILNPISGSLSGSFTGVSISESANSGTEARGAISFQPHQPHI